MVFFQRQIKKNVFFGLLLATIICFGFADSARSQDEKKDTVVESEKEEQKTWIGINGSWGRSHHIWSDREYVGYRNSQFGIFYELESAPWVSFSLPWEVDHTFRWEFRYANLWGTIPLSDDQVPPEKIGIVKETTLDHHQIVFLGIRRWVFLPDYFIRPNLHLGFGLSVTDELIIVGGTLYAFSFTGGGGIDIDVSKRWTIFTEVSWEHFSNGGQMYLTNKRVIGPEALNTRFGIRYQF